MKKNNKKRKENDGTGYGGKEKDAAAFAKGMKKAEKRKNTEDKNSIDDLIETEDHLREWTQGDDWGSLSSFLTSNEKDELLVKLKGIFRHHLPTEWDAPQKQQLIRAALGVCNVLATDIQLAFALFGFPEDSTSLISILKTLSDQAQMIATKSLDYDNQEEGSDVGIATFFLQVQEKAERAVSQVQWEFTDKKEAGSSVLSSASLAKPEEVVYKRELGLHRMDFVDKLPGHSFQNLARESNSVGDPKRLFKELISYKQSLPVEHGSSIFVRACEQSLNLLRVLIIGPEETPYANGCFFFDVYLPPSYPQECPKVRFLTTGGGKLRFNPNLYNCGKVCLSLLGTWAGPGWIPNQSTLLQVLLSIQSLIFVPDPYFNEPGFEQSRRTQKGKEASKHYNNVIERDALNYAILEQLKNSSAATIPFTTAFSHIISIHFSIKKNTIRLQLDSCLKR
eukprot:CAMPEP_0194277636 /NCGR_PEP_ID=MMETSP0169-20130528/9911_1 /TAXON_ID=218684 /ORGANISM="Corethron pennatum, Strain L29A3" /LENGTH=450 /DNA_ID=CAMNT_0039021653 /DNA_START=456 /DNA_END=1804 /DNA_ORIENTATION=-